MHLWVAQWNIEPRVYLFYGRAAGSTPVQKEHNSFHRKAAIKAINKFSIIERTYVWQASVPYTVSYTKTFLV